MKNDSVQKVLTVLGLENDVAIKNNLCLSIYINCINTLYSTSESVALVEKIKGLSENLSYEEFEKIIMVGRDHFEKSEIDFEKVMTDSIKSVLNDFVTELEPKLPTERVVKLTKIIFEA